MLNWLTFAAMCCVRLDSKSRFFRQRKMEIGYEPKQKKFNTYEFENQISAKKIVTFEERCGDFRFVR